jgi:HEAT repeat protein
MLHAMTPIDSLPTKDEIIRVFPSNTAAQLVDVAKNTANDFGVRLRAIRALPQFCLPSCAASPTYASLLELLHSVPPTDPDGKTILLLRATIEAIGVAKINDPDVVDDHLLAFLDNPSRDIRAATAFALRDLCLPNAILPLRAKYNSELVPQVRLAISAALRDLDTCGN